MSSEIRNSFTSFFPILIPFIYFSCLIALVRASNIISDSSDGNSQLYLVSDLRKKTLSFTIEYEFG